eukprot:scaffold446873_cov17-Prasinocladus_malaysianus.AAC.2
MELSPVLTEIHFLPIHQEPQEQTYLKSKVTASTSGNAQTLECQSLHFKRDDIDAYKVVDADGKKKGSACCFCNMTK